MVDKIHHAYPPYPTHLIHLIQFPSSFYPIHLLIHLSASPVVGGRQINVRWSPDGREISIHLIHLLIHLLHLLILDKKLDRIK